MLTYYTDVITDGVENSVRIKSTYEPSSYIYGVYIA